MAQKPFAGLHTQRKLDVVENYLNAFTTALKKQKFKTIYFDAFAGTGEIPVAETEQPTFFDGESLRQVVRGSVKRALELKNPFDRYVFVEKSPRKAKLLKQISEHYPDLAHRLAFFEGDANDAITRLCDRTNWDRTRAVVFLDPFGNQVRWDSVERLAKHSKADVWYLFPAGLGVNRQISRTGKVDADHARSLDGLFGGRHWEQAFITNAQEVDLFGNTSQVTSKAADADAITRYMIGRMKQPFGGRVLDEWLRLGSRGIHMYSLVFAWASPDPKARLAAKLAGAVLQRQR